MCGMNGRELDHRIVLVLLVLQILLRRTGVEDREGASSAFSSLYFLRA